LIDILIYDTTTTCFSDEWNLLFKLSSYTERAKSNKCANNEETHPTSAKSTKLKHSINVKLSPFNPYPWILDRYQNGGTQTLFRDLPKFSNIGKILRSSCLASKIVPLHEIWAHGPVPERENRTRHFEVWDWEKYP